MTFAAASGAESPGLATGVVRARRRGVPGSLALAGYLCVVAAAICLLSSDDYWHWFVVPVVACGALVGEDAVEWARGRRDVLDPASLVGLLGIHFFFLAPLLHVGWDSWMRYITPPVDWRPWLGGMALLNLLGLTLYRMTGARARGRARPGRTLWVLDEGRFLPVVVGTLAVTAGLQAWVYAQFGGIAGYVAAYGRWHREHIPSYHNMGWLFAVSESFPIVAMFGIAVLTRRRTLGRGRLTLLGVLAIMGALQLLFGGLRGSRANTVWALFWVVGIVHFWIRPISRRFVWGCVVLLVLFMYAYGFYKSATMAGVEALGDSSARAALEQETGRTIRAVVLGDLGRSDVQAFLLYQFLRSDSDAVYGLGRTYLGTLALLVPRTVWPDRPVTKVKEGTEMLWGPGTFVEHDPWTWVTNVYGLAGEAMLNFGPSAVPFAFLAIGLAVGWMRRFVGSLQPSDSRLLLAPFLILLCPLLLMLDSDIVLFHSIKDGAVPFLVVVLCSRRIPQPAAGRDDRRPA